MGRRSISSSLSKAEVVFDYLPTKRIVKVHGALCADGERRTAWMLGPPNSDFSIPARVVLGKHGRHYSISGYILMNSYQDVEFIANPWGRHAWRIQRKHPIFVRSHYVSNRRTRRIRPSDVDADPDLRHSVIAHSGQRVCVVRISTLVDDDPSPNDPPLDTE